MAVSVIEDGADHAVSLARGRIKGIALYAEDGNAAFGNNAHISVLHPGPMTDLISKKSI